MVFTTPVIRALRRRYPTATLVYLVETAAAPVVSANPHLDDVIVIPHTPRLAPRARRPASGVAAAREALRPGHRPARRAAQRLAHVGQPGPGPGRLRCSRTSLDVHAPGVSAARCCRPRHSVENQWDLLAAVDAAFAAPPDPRSRSRPRCPSTPAAAARARAHRRRAACPTTAGSIVLHVSAGNPFRRWPEAAFCGPGRAPGRRGRGPVGPRDGRAVGSGGRPPRDRRRATDAGTAAARIVDAEGLSLDELRAVLDRAALFVGGDSGPLHIAATSDVPIVGLFGPTLPERSAPWRPRGLSDAGGRRRAALPCRPCDQRTCAPGDFRCLSGDPGGGRCDDAAERLLEARPMTAGHGRSNAPAFWLLVASLGLVQFNLLAAQTLFGLSALCWLMLDDPGAARGPPLPRVRVAPGRYAVLTLRRAPPSPSTRRAASSTASSSCCC